VYKATRWSTYPGDTKWNKSRLRKEVKRKSEEEIEKEWRKKVNERSRRTFYKGFIEVRQVRGTGKSKAKDQTKQRWQDTNLIGVATKVYGKERSKLNMIPVY
jgi:hypothetical protein